MTRRNTRHEKTPIRFIVAARIREAQTEAGLRNEDLSRLTGISLRLLQKHRAGDNAPGDDSLRAYSRVLNKPLHWFFTGEPIKKAAA